MLPDCSGTCPIYGQPSSMDSGNSITMQHSPMSAVLHTLKKHCWLLFIDNPCHPWLAHPEAHSR